jgi:hypothetical protein
MILEGLKEFGTVEEQGNRNSPWISGWAREVRGNVNDIYLSMKYPGVNCLFLWSPEGQIRR